MVSDSISSILAKHKDGHGSIISILEEIQSFSLTGPVISVSCSKGAVEKATLAVSASGSAL